MKKIALAASLIIFVISCSKDNTQNSNLSIIGKWKFAGYYSDGKIEIAPMPANYINGYIFNSDSSYTQINTDTGYNISGIFSILSGKSVVNINGVQYKDSIIFNRNTPQINVSYYHINGDTLFFFPTSPVVTNGTAAYPAFLRVN